MMYLYAITDAPEGPMSEQPGLGGASLLRVTHEDIAAVVSRVDCAEVPVTEGGLWEHEAVVEALMADGSVLPLRFGAVVADEAAVESVLQAHHGEFAACLECVRGHVEIGLRALWSDAEGSRARDVPAPKLPADATGRAYLLARAREERESDERRRHAEDLATKLHAPLADLATDSTRRALATPRLLLTAAYLVARGRVPTFRREVDALGAAHPALRLLCTGPWPPYNFVTNCVPARGEEETSDARQRW
ncbi:MAG: GvpL/GvpF family gas vesicle protein [Armatimonadota bacterium]|jgi:hypothetical protein